MVVSSAGGELASGAIADMRQGVRAHDKDANMTTLTMQLSDKSILMIPADVARQAGLEEGDVRVILGEQSLTVVPLRAQIDYIARWQVMSTALREQAGQFDLSLDDRRDATYWEIVGPLFEEAERIAGSV
jgi:hypothetical protein